MNLISLDELIPLSQINGFLWGDKILDRFTDVFRDSLRVFKSLLFIPITESSNDRANSASSGVWTSTILEIFSSFEADIGLLPIFYQ